MKPGNTGLTRLVKALGYSLQGLAAAWRHEAAFRQELLLLAVAFPAALWLGRGAVEWSLLLGTLLLVLVTELVNSAIEAVVDRHGPERHPLAGRAKDLGSAAVLVALLLAGLVWGLIAWERFLA